MKIGLFAIPGNIESVAGDNSHHSAVLGSVVDGAFARELHLAARVLPVEANPSCWKRNAQSGWPRSS